MDSFTPTSGTAGRVHTIGRLPQSGTLAARQGEFASVLARGRNRVGDSAQERRDAARSGAEEFVAITMVQPLLKQLRETSHAAAPFAPSSAELQFRGMMDAQLAQRIVRASNFPLVDVVARNLERAAADAQGAQA
jgi:Rod binding domain-containing protein